MEIELGSRKREPENRKNAVHGRGISFKELNCFKKRKGCEVLRSRASFIGGMSEKPPIASSDDCSGRGRLSKAIGVRILQGFWIWQTTAGLSRSLAFGFSMCDRC
jgi:hypothetical protein